MTRPVNSLAGYVPLVYLDGRVVLSRLNRIYVADLRLENLEYICSVGHLGVIGRFLSRLRLIQRLLRLDMGPATPLQDKGCLLVFFRGQAFHVDTLRREVRPESIPGLTRNPLQLLLVQSGPHKDAVLVGDYVRNADYDPVNIYRRDRNGSWTVAHVFPKGEVNHIHGIYEDAARDCFYILTGDFGQAACIWKADMALADVWPMVRQGQMSRACWIIRRGETLVFATDQQEDFNYLCTVDDKAIERINRHFPIAGSSICFSSTHTDTIVFSTAVEPEPSGKLTFSSLLSMRRASGILSDRACIYAGTPEGGFRMVFSGKKDVMPFGLFQFGNIRFPSGISPDSSFVHFYCSALRGHDGVAYAVQLNQNQSEKQVCAA